jgi:hypothetical protein
MHDYQIISIQKPDIADSPESIIAVKLFGGEIVSRQTVIKLLREGNRVFYRLGSFPSSNVELVEDTQREYFRTWGTRSKQDNILRLPQF